MNIQETVSFINSVRLQNKNKWYTITLIGIDSNFNNFVIRVKAFNTWLQIFTINNIDNSNCMDRNISDYKYHIEKTLNSYKFIKVEKDYKYLIQQNN